MEDSRIIRLKNLHGIEKGWAVSAFEVDRYRASVVSRVSSLMQSLPSTSIIDSSNGLEEVAQLRQGMRHSIDARSQQVHQVLEAHVEFENGKRTG